MKLISLSFIHDNLFKGIVVDNNKVKFVIVILIKKYYNSMKNMLIVHFIDYCIPTCVKL